MSKIISIADHGAVPGGEVLCTAAIQSAIDAAGAGDTVLIPAGVWLSGAVFLHSRMTLRFEEGAELRGTTDESCYPILPTRVAGVEMDWPAALVNANDCEELCICGPGVINGQGEHWWYKYWGDDFNGGMRKGYLEKGLMGFLDYDCLRVRNLIVMNGKNITLEDFHSTRSGFWNVHVCYCENVTIRGLQIYENHGPSTDGIDIDSSRHVLVENCVVACNDDNVCIKAGRDADGLRVARPCEDVLVQNCVFPKGHGLTLGSETSGGIRNITMRNITFNGNMIGFRLKSARKRGGIIENILVENLTMTDVGWPFRFEFDWYPAYSYSAIPEDWEGEIPQRWHTLSLPVDPELGLPEAKNITIRNVTATLSPEYDGPSLAFDIEGIPEKPFRDFLFENVKIEAKTFGVIRHTKNLRFVDVDVSVQAED